MIAAQVAVDTCEAKGYQVSVAVVDSAGLPVVLLSGDGAAAITQSIAMGKAVSSVKNGKPSAELAARGTDRQGTCREAARRPAARSAAWRRRSDPCRARPSSAQSRLAAPLTPAGTRSARRPDSPRRWPSPPPRGQSARESCSSFCRSIRARADTATLESARTSASFTPTLLINALVDSAPVSAGPPGDALGAFPRDLLHLHLGAKQPVVRTYVNIAVLAELAVGDPVVGVD